MMPCSYVFVSTNIIICVFGYNWEWLVDVWKAKCWPYEGQDGKRPASNVDQHHQAMEGQMTMFGESEVIAARWPAVDPSNYSNYNYIWIYQDQDQYVYIYIYY